MNKHLTKIPLPQYETMPREFFYKKMFKTVLLSLTRLLYLCYYYIYKIQPLLIFVRGEYYMKKRIISSAVAGAMALTMLPTLPADTSLSAAAASDVTEVRGQCASYEGTNAGAQTYDRWSKVINSYLFADGEGYLRVQGDAVSGKLLAEYYSSDFTLQKSVAVNLDLPIFGGFYSAGDSYYVLTGQNNKSENNSTEVFRITKYDKNWKRLGSSGLYGANTTKPFNAGTARFTQSGKYLLVRTCHEMYTSSKDGKNHQSNVTIQFDMDTMKITDSFSDVMNTGYGYVSHSFNQFIRT